MNTRILSVLLVLSLADHVPAESLGSHRAESLNSLHRLWLVSTRQASCGSPSQAQTSRLKYWRSDAAGCWQRSTLADLLATDDPAVTTLLYVHENRVTRSESFCRAQTLFSRLSRVAPPDKPFRLIAISWPADRISCRPRPDAQAKAHRSQAHGYYLAWLMDQMDPDVPISLFGYSFGPRMITAALHYLGGGSIHGRRLPARVHPVRKPVRAVLMASAIDVHWLAPGQHHGQALTQAEQVLIMFNPCDKVLRWYPRMYGRGGPDALGYVGLSCRARLEPYQEKLVEWNVSGLVGRTHGWAVYEGSPAMLRKVVPHLLGD